MNGMVKSLNSLRRGWLLLAFHTEYQLPGLVPLLRSNCRLIFHRSMCTWLLSRALCRSRWESGWCHSMQINSSAQKILDKEDGIKINSKAQSTLQMLLDSGCREVEFYESPEVLKLSPSEVKHRLRRLKSLNVELDITPVMVSLAGERKNSLLKRLVKKYQAEHGGQSSRARQLRSRLNLSDNDMQLLVDSGAKVVHSAAKIKSVECLEWLLWKGYSLKEIVDVPGVLDKSVEVISGRHKDITSFSMDRPPLEYLSLTNKQYHQLLQRFKINPQAADAIRMTGQWMHARSTAVTNLKQMEPVWDFLSAQGFKNDDIKTYVADLLKVDFGRLQDIVTSSKILTSFSVNLYTIILLCNQSVKARKSALKRLLNCSVKDLPSAQRGSPFALLYAQDPSVYFENLQFLLDASFSLSHIAKCPVVIGHRPQTVKHCWSCISEWDSVNVQEIKHDPEKCLEMLQYEIEKESNFMHGILI